MFTPRALYHPYYRPSTPSSPAGFRITDYINPKGCFNLFQGPNFTDTRSPDPSPSSSPVRGPHHPQDDPPPTIRLADFFKRNLLGFPPCPSTPNDPRIAPTPNVQKAQAPLPNPPHRRGKHGLKHLSFNNGVRPGPVPPHRRAQQLKEKRDAARRRVLDRHERRVLRAREGLDRLRMEAETLMTPVHMDAQDEIFLRQLQALQLDQVLKQDLEQCRQRVARAADESTKRIEEHAEKDVEAETMRREVPEEEARKEQKRKVDAFLRAKEARREARRRRVEEMGMRMDEERQRAHDALERKIREEQEHLFRQELARKVQEEERRKREEEERRRQEERERRLREEKERRQQEERGRMLREEVERLRRLAHEQFLREQKERIAREEREQRERVAREERERQARFLAEQARRAAEEDQAPQHFVVYEAKWNELRTNDCIPPIDVQEMPWPVLGAVSSADQITYQAIRTFLFHPLRPDVEGKTARDKVKSEVLRFHPDKFNARIIPKIQPSQRALAQDIAGAIARILTAIMTEEVEQQK